MRIDKDVKKQEHTQVKEVGHDLGEDVHHEIKVFLCNKDFWVRLPLSCIKSPPPTPTEYHYLALSPLLSRYRDG